MRRAAGGKLRLRAWLKRLRWYMESAMKRLGCARPGWLGVVCLLALVAPASMLLAAQASQTANAPVTVVDNGRSWTMDNGIVKVTVNKDNGSLTSLVYRGFDTGSHGIWEHTPQGAPQVTNSITIDPATNGGERAEVSI